MCCHLSCLVRRGRAGTYRHCCFLVPLSLLLQHLRGKGLLCKEAEQQLQEANTSDQANLSKLEGLRDGAEVGQRELVAAYVVHVAAVAWVARLWVAHTHRLQQSGALPSCDAMSRSLSACLKRRCTNGPFAAQAELLKALEECSAPDTLAAATAAFVAFS